MTKSMKQMTASRYNPADFHSNTLELAGHPFAFNTNSARIWEAASTFFSPDPSVDEHSHLANITLLSHPRRAGSGTNEKYRRFRGRNEFVHADYGADGSIWFDLRAREVLGRLSEEIIAEEAFFRRAVLAVIAGILAPSLGVIAVHAACVVRAGKAILLAAPSGTGKSTISLFLALRGWSLLSDDWTFVSSTNGSLRVWGMQTALKLLPDAVNHFSALAPFSPAESLNGELSFEIDPWTLFGVDRAVDAIPAGLVFLTRKPSEDNSGFFHVTASGHDESLATLLTEIEQQPEQTVGNKDARLSHLSLLCRLPSLKVSFGGEPSAVAADLDELIRERFCA